MHKTCNFPLSNRRAEPITVSSKISCGLLIKIIHSEVRLIACHWVHTLAVEQSSGSPTTFGAMLRFVLIQNNQWRLMKINYYCLIQHTAVTAQSHLHLIKLWHFVMPNSIRNTRCSLDTVWLLTNGNPSVSILDPNSNCFPWQESQEGWQPDTVKLLT